MLYVSYVAIVAILNVCMGFALAMVVGGPRSNSALLSRGECDDDGENNRGLQTGNSVEPVFNISLAAELADVREVDTGVKSLEETSAAGVKTRRDESDGSWAGIATVALDHSEAFQTKLLSILQRVSAASQENEVDELRQLTQLTLGAAADWLADAERVSSRLLASLADTPDGKTVADRCERVINDQLAQTETSTSNISMIDWQADVPAGTTRLSQELTRLVESSAEMQTKVQQLVDFVYQQAR